MILNKNRPLKDNIYPYISQKTTTFALVLRKVKHVRFFKTHHKYISNGRVWKGTSGGCETLGFFFRKFINRNEFV